MHIQDRSLEGTDSYYIWTGGDALGYRKEEDIEAAKQGKCMSRTGLYASPGALNLLRSYSPQDSRKEKQLTVVAPQYKLKDKWGKGGNNAHNTVV